MIYNVIYKGHVISNVDLKRWKVEEYKRILAKALPGAIIEKIEKTEETEKTIETNLESV